ncbi:hypothetical protein Leryth_013111 [Lithospermum erythrorhizon]|nr:hypothetical protein Leryth_013111 [Lithospermum erythrorhizon]
MPLKKKNVELASFDKTSETLPMPLGLTNALFFTLFFAVVYYLMIRWREKIRNSTPLHVVSFPEIAAIVALMASCIYLLGFLSIGLVQLSMEDEVEEEETSVEECNRMTNSKNINVDQVTFKDDCNEVSSFGASPKVTAQTCSEEDENIIQSVVQGKTPSYSLESKLGDCFRAAAIRREALQRITGKSLEGLPLEHFDYDSILGQCCEMPVGYVQIPVGIAGPLLLDDKEYSVYDTTEEGAGGYSTNQRAPVVRFGTAKRAAELKFFLEDPLNFETLALLIIPTDLVGYQASNCYCCKNLYMRFSCSTGDAMGMNMVSKGTQHVIEFLEKEFPDMDVIGISGNYCSDKKPAAVNWIEGRGKSVVCEAIIPEEVVNKVLKTDVASLVELNMLKNLTGSAMAGALGGFNAHASNIVSAIFIATGQDPAQNIESSHCITMMEAVNDGKDLHVSVTMPSIEVGTVGGGTQLASQSACLNLLGVKGANREVPGANARQLATIVAGSVLAGELSLMSAIAAGQLVKSHMKYNRSNKATPK